MSIAIGEVTSVKGIHIVIELYEESNKETIFYNGEKFKGVSIREHILIKRGFRDIVALVQGEYLDDRSTNNDGKLHVRKIDLKPIGFYHDDKFQEGIKYLPMIRDTAYLMSESQVQKIYGNPDSEFIIGELLKEELPLSLPWAKLFNTHIGVFGNTGSGKSNTLTNLYTTLFNNKHHHIKGKSTFVVIDFNGEYTEKQLIDDKLLKKVYDLDTRTGKGEKFTLSEAEFWDSEVFGILFKATENTQKPFLNKIVTDREKYKNVPNSLSKYTKDVLERALTSASPKKEFPELIREIANIADAKSLEKKARNITWFANNNTNKLMYGRIISGGENDPIYTTDFKPEIDNIQISNLSNYDELRLRINLKLLSDLISSHIQFEHIQPLLKRVVSSIDSLKKILTIGENPTDSLLTIISLRKSKPEIKKIIPLLIAKYYYNKHKTDVLNASPPDKTFHLIIDEAHNILSMQSSRESESWKDYRLELFEEIIKEGRKFGFFLTLSSQRPADISPTIMSQIHNFFIHRLVNDRDLLLLENSISTLDSLSRSMIPNLARGCAIVTGTSFDLPMVVQFNELPKNQKPDSDDVDLLELWK